MLLSLTDLLISSDGLRFLESKGVVVDRKEFEAQLRSPITRHQTGTQWPGNLYRLSSISLK